MTWDPRQYAAFAAERGRPFFDLLAHVPDGPYRAVVDLGCGSGELTRTLADRWPGAAVEGLDNSAAMLARAAAHALPGRLTFRQADVATWQPERPLDLIVSNAALQWVGDHEGLLPRLVAALAPGGVLAVQMPYLRGHRAHEVIDAVVHGPRWRDRLAGAGLTLDSVRPLPWYVERLQDVGCRVDAWETIYVHVLQGGNPVLEWVKGTTLRPHLARLSAEEAEEYLAEVGEQLRAAHPATAHGTLYPFHRLFFVARKGGRAQG